MIILSTVGPSESSCSLCTLRSSLAPTGLLICTETVSGRLTNTGPFIEDEDDPDIRRRIAGHQISWHMLHDHRFSPAGTWPPPRIPVMSSVSTAVSTNQTYPHCLPSRSQMSGINPTSPCARPKTPSHIPTPMRPHFHVLSDMPWDDTEPTTGMSASTLAAGFLSKVLAVL
jgi:hypothetical protein